MGDQERIGRRTPVHGVPVVEIDPELTPPPTSLIDFTLDEVESAEDKINIIFQMMKKQAEGLDRVWDNRHNGTHIQSLKLDVNELTKSVREFMLPAVKTLTGRMTNMESIAQARQTQEQIFYTHEWPTFKKSFEQLVTNQNRIEKDVDRMERTFDQFVAKYDGHQNISNQRYEELKNKDNTQEIRLRKLEDFTLEWKVRVTMISTAASGIVAAIVWILNKYT